MECYVKTHKTHDQNDLKLLGSDPKCTDLVTWVYQCMSMHYIEGIFSFGPPMQEEFNVTLWRYIRCLAPEDVQQ